MARGSVHASSRTRREEQTRLLFAELEMAEPSERQRIAIELVELNLPLCDALAARYRGRGVDLDDLVQVARTDSGWRFTGSGRRMLPRSCRSPYRRSPAS